RGDRRAPRGAGGPDPAQAPRERVHDRRGHDRASPPRVSEKLRDLREKALAAALVAVALYVTYKQATVLPAPDAPRDDAMATFSERLARLPHDALYLRVFWAWLGTAFFTSGLVAWRAAQRLRRGERPVDTLDRPPAWGILEFALVFVLSQTCAQLVA